jgi:hypothetical protein
MLRFPLRFPVCIALSLLLSLIGARAQIPPSPAAVPGFPAGSRPARYDEVVRYFGPGNGTAPRVEWQAVLRDQ